MRTSSAGILTVVDLDLSFIIYRRGLAGRSKVNNP